MIHVPLGLLYGAFAVLTVVTVAAAGFAVTVRFFPGLRARLPVVKRVTACAAAVAFAVAVLYMMSGYVRAGVVTLAGAGLLVWIRLGLGVTPFPAAARGTGQAD